MQFGDLRVEVTRSLGQIRVDFRGKGNDRSPETILGPFLSELGRKALQDKSLLDMHFGDLEFFNSSTITVIIQFVKEARAKQLRLQLTYNPAKKWQKVFFDALWMFEKADGLIKIQPVV